jgi:hypothetical protein
MSNEEQPQNINGYLSAFVTMVSAELPDEEPGAAVMSELISVLVSTNNKRKIQLHIRTRPNEVLRVTYVMPVHKGYSQLFAPHEPKHVIPHEDPTFARIPDVVPDAGMAPWADEIIRVKALEVQETAANPASLRARVMRSLLAYWGNCRTQILGLLSDVQIKGADAIVAAAPPPSESTEPGSVAPSSEVEEEWLAAAAGTNSDPASPPPPHNSENPQGGGRRKSRRHKGSNRRSTIRLKLSRI